MYPADLMLVKRSSWQRSGLDGNCPHHKCQFKNKHKENNRVPSLFDFDQIDVKIGVFRWKICSVLALKLRYVINKIKNR